MDDKKRVAAAIRDYLARERVSREQFAFKTKLGKSTVDKLLIGLYSDRTLAIVERRDRPAAARAEPAAPPAPVAEAPKPEKPSIAVMPFANMSGDPEHEFLADGLTEDIITALARLNWLFVIARNSTFVYKNKPTDVRAVARDLGVRYVLEGSVRMADRRLRISGQLVEAETGKHVWAHRYDRVLEDLFAVQDDITERVVGAVEPHLYAEEGFRAASRQTERIDAWGLVVRALTLINKVERRQNEEAQEMLRSAIALEPRYARAHALLGWAKWWAALCYWFDDDPRGLSPSPPAMRRMRWRSTPATLGHAWFRGCASRPKASMTARSASCASRCGSIQASRSVIWRMAGDCCVPASSMRRSPRPGRRCGSHRSTISWGSTWRSTASRCLARSASPRRCRSCAARSRPSPNTRATTTR